MITNELLESFVLSCRSCPKICNRNPYPFPAFYEGSYKKDLMIIGQSPGVEHSYSDVDSKTYLEMYKKNFKQCNFFSYLNRIGLKEDSYYFTNIIKCPLKPGEDVDPSYVANCSKYLKLQMELVKPVVLLLLSKHAASYFYRVENRHEVYLVDTGNNIAKCIYSYHPSYLRNMPKIDSDKVVETLRVLLRQCGVL